MTVLIFNILAFIIAGCSSESSGGGGTTTNNNAVSITVGDVFSHEGGTFEFVIRLSAASTTDVTVDYNTRGRTAEGGLDFESTSGSATIPAGSTRVTINVPTIDDSVNELDERLNLILTNATNATIQRTTARGVIFDNDNISFEGEYATADAHFGYDLVWADEFDNGINPDNYTFEMGDGCPSLCGWGNNELQKYTDQDQNVFIRDGSLVIRAIKDPINGITSTRMITKGKREFKFGRIDIRAKLPEGQGIWPALWMLGTNIDDVGWPNCGEIDIMEMIGHQANTVHGTAHWGPRGQGHSDHKGSSQVIPEKFSENYHVFTLLWEQNSLVWYLDEEKFNTITTEQVTSTAYPFNKDFFFIFNIAVGGNWPGAPDDSTVFPQEMSIDYIRVFQESE